MHGNFKRVSPFIHHDCAAETCKCSIPPKSDWVRCEETNLYLHKYFRTLLLSVSKFSGFNSKNRLFSHGFYLLDLFERYVYCILVPAEWIHYDHNRATFRTFSLETMLLCGHFPLTRFSYFVVSSQENISNSFLPHLNGSLSAGFH